MTIDMSTTRTDLALESVQAACSGAEAGTISGVRSRERTREGYAVTDIRVEDEDGAQALGKPVGRYVTVDLGPYFRREADYFDRGVRCLAGELAALLPEGPVLAAGLGNRAMTCDAVGPASIDNLLVTRHMIRPCPGSLRISGRWRRCVPGCWPGRGWRPWSWCGEPWSGCARRR